MNQNTILITLIFVIILQINVAMKPSFNIFSVVSTLLLLSYMYVVDFESMKWTVPLYAVVAAVALYMAKKRRRRKELSEWIVRGRSNRVNN